jgi:hypothetical protein
VDGQSFNAVLTAAGVLEVTLSVADVTRLSNDTGTLEITISQQENITLTIPAAALGSDSALVINTDFGSVSIPAETMQVLARMFGNNPVRLSIIKGSFRIRLLDLTGREIAYNNPNNPITLTLPYPRNAGETAESVVAVRRVGTNEVIMPYSVYENGSVTFNITRTGTYDVIYNRQELPDVSGHWAEDYINFLSARNLADASNAAGEFQPELIVTRAMFAVMFAQIEGADLTGYSTSRFGDVRPEQWFSKAVEWAADAGIVQVGSDNLFAPNRRVTREEIAAMLYRYIQYKNWDTEPADEEVTFADSADIADWAKEAAVFMRQTGIMEDKPGDAFDPQGAVTRAELAAIFARFIRVFS